MTTFSDVWVDLIRQAHADIADEEAVLFTRPDGSLAWVSYLAIDLPGLPAQDCKASRLVACGTTLDGKPSWDAYLHADDFPAEFAPLIQALTEAQRDRPLDV